MQSNCLNHLLEDTKHALNCGNIEDWKGIGHLATEKHRVRRSLYLDHLHEDCWWQEPGIHAAKTPVQVAYHRLQARTPSHSQATVGRASWAGRNCHSPWELIRALVCHFLCLSIAPFSFRNRYIYIGTLTWFLDGCSAVVLKCLADSQDFSYIRCVDRVPSFEAAWVASNAWRLSPQILPNETSRVHPLYVGMTIYVNVPLCIWLCLSSKMVPCVKCFVNESVNLCFMM